MAATATKPAPLAKLQRAHQTALERLEKAHTEAQRTGAELAAALAAQAGAPGNN